MKGARPPKGFTIVETLIFLAVTGALFISVMALISGKQAQTDFDQSIRDFQLELQSLIANVNNGYDNAGSGFTCSYLTPGSPANGVVVQDSAGPTNRGINLDCISVGEAIQFWPASRDATAYDTYTLVGARETVIGGVSRDVKDLTEAQPIAVAPGTAAPYNSISANNIDKKFITGGTKVAKVTAETAQGVLVPVGTIAVTTSFPSLDNISQKLNNSPFAVNVSAVGCTTLNQDEAQLVDTLRTGLKGAPCVSSAPVIMNPDYGIHICLSGGSNKLAVETIGGNQNGNGQGTVTLKIYDDTDPAATGYCKP